MNRAGSDHSPTDASHPIDECIRRAIELQSQQLDCRSLADRILASKFPHRSSTITSESGMMAKALSPARPESEPISVATSPNTWQTAGRRRSTWWRAALMLSTSAVVLFAFALGRWDSLANASATNLVRAARSVHSLGIERCYLLTVEKTSADGSKLDAPRIKDVRIWTQGDRFWVEAKVKERKWAWGRTADGAVWLTLGDHRALQLEADEIGQPLQQICDFHSLELDSLLANFQNRWSLTSRTSTDFIHTIIARPKHGPYRRISEATLEVDRETKAIRRLILLRNAGTASESRVTFTLVDAREPDESKYEPAGHLSESHRIFSRSYLPEKRLESLSSWFGSGVEHWINQL